MFEWKKKELKSVPPDGMTFFVTAEDKIEADVLESKLVAYGIPVVRQYRETGAYLTILLGNTSFGIDMFVPSDKLEEAKDILANQEIGDEEILQDPSFSDESLQAANEEFVKKLDRGIWWMASIFIIVMVAVIYFLVKG